MLFKMISSNCWNKYAVTQLVEVHVPLFILFLSGHGVRGQNIEKTVDELILGLVGSDRLSDSSARPVFSIDHFGPGAVVVGGIAESPGFIWLLQEMNHAMNVWSSVAHDCKTLFSFFDNILNESVAQREPSNTLDTIFFYHSFCKLFCTLPLRRVRF